jgi:pyridoxamine 5'-phosphate oxidase
MKDIKACIEFANANKVCYLATVEGDQPRVRALGFWYADGTGFYFQIGAVKAMYGQLRKNPKVEACFYDNKSPIGTMLRVAGKVEFVDDRAVKERAMKDRPFLKDMGLNADSPGLIVFRIAHGQAHYWTMADNLKAKEPIGF